MLLPGCNQIGFQLILVAVGASKLKIKVIVADQNQYAANQMSLMPADQDQDAANPMSLMGAHITQVMPTSTASGHIPY